MCALGLSSQVRVWHTQTRRPTDSGFWGVGVRTEVSNQLTIWFAAVLATKPEFANLNFTCARAQGYSHIRLQVCVRVSHSMCVRVAKKP